MKARRKLLPVSGRHFEFRGKESQQRLVWRSLKRVPPENMGTTVRILSLGGTEPDIHLGIIYPPPIATYVCKKVLQY